MKFSLVFENSGDSLPFIVINNHKIFEFFVDHITNNGQNCFQIDSGFYTAIDSRITNLHWAVSKTNEVLYDLIEVAFDQCVNLEDYLNQRILNKLHSDWVLSHNNNIDIDVMRANDNLRKSKLGYSLHELYPDDIRVIQTVPALEKLGYLYPYREVNMNVHRLEGSFESIEFLANDKWEVFDNIYRDTMITNNDVVNFSFGYTYVGRQYYNKFRFFDTELEFPDHYNYEKLELAFQLSLANPETIPFSKESLEWAKQKGVELIAEQIPIANLVDLNSNLFEYRKILYRNSRDNNRASIIID